jgi:hypothetical protein
VSIYLPLAFALRRSACQSQKALHEVSMAKAALFLDNEIGLLISSNFTLQPQSHALLHQSGTESTASPRSRFTPIKAVVLHDGLPIPRPAAFPSDEARAKQQRRIRLPKFRSSFRGHGDRSQRSSNQKSDAYAICRRIWF